MPKLPPILLPTTPVSPRCHRRKKALVWYPYDVSPEFPLMGSGGRNAMAGPVYYADDFKHAPHAFPKYYDGKFFAYEWMRGFYYGHHVG
jgi:hypothetical protein